MYQFIVNPGAGAGRGYRIWKRLEHQLEMNSQEYRVFFTEHQGDAAEIARVLTAEKDEAKVIVIVGGGGRGKGRKGRSDDHLEQLQLRLYAGGRGEVSSGQYGGKFHLCDHGDWF